MTYQVRPFDLSGVQGLSKKALDLHLGLYKGYVAQINTLMEQMADSKITATPLVADGYARRFAFEHNGVVLHELFFEQLVGNHRAPSRSSGLLSALTHGYGGFDGWKSAIESVAKTRGVGWVIAVSDPVAGRVHTSWVDLHQLSLPANRPILFVLDLWEHAFLTDFAPAQRGDYVKVVLDNVDWPVLEARFARGESRESAHA